MKKRDFTLVELLAVTALIAILAGIGFAAFSYASNRGREAATKSLITRVAAGLESMRTKNGIFPGSTGGAYGDIVVTVNASGIVTGIAFGGSALSAKQLKTFLTVCDGEGLKKNLDGSGVVTDAWGGKIKYCCPGKINTTKFDLVAPGPDEEFGTAKASAPPVSAPTGKTVLDNYKTDGEWACDDIANFN